MAETAKGRMCNGSASKRLGNQRQPSVAKVGSTGIENPASPGKVAAASPESVADVIAVGKASVDSVGTPLSVASPANLPKARRPKRPSGPAHIRRMTSTLLTKTGRVTRPPTILFLSLPATARISSLLRSAIKDATFLRRSGTAFFLNPRPSIAVSA